ncbi:ras GTPase-activating-like protein IQGAP1 isoform X2 [Actinia tenebrosa]|uniref:Ras GTPase-activating-like protein IQGAP1 isoform X2 n=1 Tax=Actinia tenebrosa TaxID=6105 RepID=A0A6P8I1X5_ACTTE|nr:ras GTPase-activating-like protein IQGAP1 isoform X2 [Actinia tenebrosa]
MENNIDKEDGHWEPSGIYESGESGLERASGTEMDEQRKQNLAYQYLCHLEEAKVWMEACLKEDLPETTELEESMRNGVHLAKLGNFFAPKVVPHRRIFDKELKHFLSKGLHFRHTDNINYFFKALDDVGLPKVFFPETTDIYDKKNMPKLIYCIHALSLFLFKLGLAPQIQDLYGKAEFTEEQISAMRKELEKYGLQLPAFSKIGGILESELPVDEAALHAAVIAINEAIDHQDATGTMEAMKNPNAHLVDLDSENTEEYQNLLYEAKSTKTKQALAKSPGSDKEEDIYDKYLTQAEIQGNINQVNETIRKRKAEEALKKSINNINSMLDGEDLEALIAALSDKSAGLRNVDGQNGPWYLMMLREKRQVKQETTGDPNAQLTQSEIQESINGANEAAETHRQMQATVSAINKSLDGENAEETHMLIQKQEAMLPKVLGRSAYLYHYELKKAKNQKQADLEHIEIEDRIKVLTAAAAINAAIDKQNADELMKTMEDPNSELSSVDETLGRRYLDHFMSVKHEKAQDCGIGKDDLTPLELQICVDYVNAVVQEEHDLIAALSVINVNIDKGDADETTRSLQAAAAKLSGVDAANAEIYQDVLFATKRSKAQKTNDRSAELWHDEIQPCIDHSNKHADETHQLAQGLVAINQAIDRGDQQSFSNALGDSAVGIRGVTQECTEKYLHALQEAKQKKKENGGTSPWLEQRTSYGHVYYYNNENGQTSWTKPDDFKDNSSLLTKEEIQTVVSRETGEHDRMVYLTSNEPTIIKLQAHWKGYLARKSYKNRVTFIKEQLPAIIKIQANIKGFLQRTKYRKRLKELKSSEQDVIKIQSHVRMFLARKHYRGRKKYFDEHQAAIIKIQAWVRANVAQNDYRKLISMQDPPVKTVRKFIHLLQHSDADFEEELELQKLRAQVVTDIRSNQQLENDLNLMDIKIGLLVKNRITLQDVVHHGKKLKREKQDMMSAVQRTKGIKSLSKESREKLEAYQNLFYLLQTNPTYLAKLIFEMPQSKTTKFMESVVLTLYNYASNTREEYLLLRLFETALRQEICSKVDQPVEIITGNPTVIRMVVHFNRGQRGQSSLRDLLQPLVNDILKDKNINVNTSPQDVYKSWINQMETETGQTSKLPYDVDPEQALKHPEVVERIGASVKTLIAATDKFLNSIIQSVDKIPFGLRYVAMTLRVSLMEKFPNVPEDEILKVVGNLIYYRYMNPAIVAPDAFDIVNLSVEKGLLPEQRRNLGIIAKLLQFAASNKLVTMNSNKEEWKASSDNDLNDSAAQTNDAFNVYDGANSHLGELNNYIKEAHIKFKKYFLEVSTVEEPESRFNIDEYTDVVMLTKPVIYISVQEICDTHTLLLEHQEQIAPDVNDPLHELLDDLGDAPNVKDLIGGNPDDEDEDQELANVAKTEISLMLTNKFEVPDDDDSDMRALFVRTKRLIVDVLMVQQGENLTEILETPATEEQETAHTNLVKEREKNEERKRKNTQVRRSASIYGDNKLPLEGLKRKIIRNLRMLESQGLVTIKNDYQDIVNAIAKDIRNQRRYRQRRRQERKKLKQTLESLQTKTHFYEEQIDYYNQYIRVCLDNLSKMGKKPSRGIKQGKKAKEEVYKGELKYSAQRLYEKGVILEIEGLPPAQFKNVMFEIKSGDDVGSFAVSAKFMGVAMEKVELVFQDLLQLQYEGVAVMKMFGRAKINVNLLIFLLNKKFYGK